MKPRKPMRGMPITDERKASILKSINELLDAGTRVQWSMKVELREGGTWSATGLDDGLHKIAQEGLAPR